MREVYRLGPLAAEHAIGVAAASYDGSVFFGVVAAASSPTPARSTCVGR
jgi:hypothetical protein